MDNYKTLIFDGKNSISFTVQLGDFDHPTIWQTCFEELDLLFEQQPQLEALNIQNTDHALVECLTSRLPIAGVKLNRYAFYQMPLFWHKHKVSTQFPKYLVQSDSRYRHHPLRPPMPQGCVYKRFDSKVQAEVSFRLIDTEKDLTIFTRWMNDPRVAEFWEQAWSEDQLLAFLLERLADDHIIPLIGEFNGQPFGYIEVYWVAEDRLSPYFDVQDFDRGIHLLVGEQTFRGPDYFNAWIKAISHYIFIDDVRTQRIVLEPRSDNQRLFNRILPMGFEKQFEFNFPHKRSALLMQNRDRFFKEQW
ncbi:GNAT family N-acetyltransferase [Vibrio sagamiensis]|uniref:Aerobactin siderophore synthesis protein IucB n=1 Tax=Vibrio sagamiensis NBRC 104589 TaxID=1219064 RepID=A0A511QBM2_9VIBR|nr:GNAT family N-acetyltransferase [Vibrio sagamiensis]PNQ64536.1 N-acetyltransferase [Vibrio agarivorans]GEM74668.1 aerobactin siderophore synthesis protein IucB [Vibrio sagamiensis NBRC 104589]